MDIDINQNSKQLFYRGILKIDKPLTGDRDFVTFRFLNPGGSLALEFQQHFTKQNIELINRNIEMGYNKICYLIYSAPGEFSMFCAQTKKVAETLERIVAGPIEEQMKFVADLTSQLIIDDVDTTEINNNNNEED